MSALKDILSDMKEAKALVEARGHHGGSSAKALQRQLGTSIASKIAKLPALSPGDAAPLLEAVHSCGQPEAGVQVLVAAIDAKLSESLDAEEDKPASVNHMLLKRAQNWVTDSLMNTLRGTASIDIKLNVAADYLANKLGCTHPHEQTYKNWLTLVLLSHYTVWPRYSLVYSLLQQFKGDLKTVRKGKKCTFAKIASYPRMPHELPTEIFEIMFPDETPIVVEIPRFQVTADNHVPLRKNSKLIRNELAAEGKTERSSSDPSLPKPKLEQALQRVKEESQGSDSQESVAPEWVRRMVTDVIAEKFPAVKLEQGTGGSSTGVGGEASSAAGQHPAPAISDVIVGAGPAPPPPSGLQPKGLRLRCDVEQDGLHTLCNCIHASRIFLYA